jgi:hypothetical protein
MNKISETYQQKVIKVWSYNVEMTPEKLLNPHYQNQVVRYIACVHEKNPINDSEFKYISMVDTNNSQVSFQLFEDADIKTRLKYEDWLKNNFIPIACMPENVDYSLGLHYVRLLNGRTLIIPHAICPELLDKKINEISLILLTEDFCQKNEII